MDKVKKYFWTTDDEHLNGENTFDTVEECLREARYYWLNGDYRFSVQDPDLREDSVIVTVGKTKPVDFRPFIMKMLNRLKDDMEDYINDNYGFCPDVEGLTDADRKARADFVTPILDSTTGHRFYSKSGSLEHDYEITRDWYKMIN